MRKLLYQAFVWGLPADSEHCLTWIFLASDLGPGTASELKEWLLCLKNTGSVSVHASSSGGVCSLWGKCCYSHFCAAISALAF